MPHTAERLTNESALTDVGDARRLILQEARRLASEHVPLRDALARVVVVDIRATDPVPAFDSSAVDGTPMAASLSVGSTGTATATATGRSIELPLPTSGRRASRRCSSASRLE